MELRPGYKRTEVGVIPEDWEVRTVEELGHVTSGKRLPAGATLVDRPTPHPYVRVTDMRPGTVSLANIKFVPEHAFPAISRYRIFREDIFISVAGTLGIVGKVPDEIDGANLTENADRITNLKCSQAYLLQVLSSPLIQSVIESIRTVGAQPKLALTRIRQFAIPLPPTNEEQEAIGAAIGDLDELLNGMSQLLAKKRDLKQSTMQQLLTGRRRLRGHSGSWRRVNLADSSTLKARIGWQGLTTAEYRTSGDYLLVTGTDMVEGRISWSGCHYVSSDRYAQDRHIQLREQDVLLTKDGTIGKTAYVDGLPTPATLNSGVFVIRPRAKGYNPKFLYYILNSRVFGEFLSRLAAGSTIAHLYQKDFVDFSFLAPSTIAEQTAIAEVLSDMDAELTALEARLEKTKALKQAMMQELLSGRTRLVAPEPAYA